MIEIDKRNPHELSHMSSPVFFALKIYSVIFVCCYYDFSFNFNSQKVSVLLRSITISRNNQNTIFQLVSDFAFCNRPYSNCFVWILNASKRGQFFPKSFYLSHSLCSKLQKSFNFSYHPNFGSVKYVVKYIFCLIIYLII